MCIAILLHTADVSLGRLDKASFSDQPLMETVISGIINKEVICGAINELKIIPEWRGVTLKDGKVIAIDWQRYDLEGSLRLEWLPSTVTMFFANNNQLTGTIDFASLPPAMWQLSLEFNALSGTIDLHTLPADLVYLVVGVNRLSGSADLTELPGNIQTMYLENNRFGGSVDLTRLPERLKYLFLRVNAFSGTVDLSHLPYSIVCLDLSKTQLSGEVLIIAELFPKVRVEDTKLTKMILEVAPRNPKNVLRIWQTSLMDQFYASISEDGKNEFSNGNTSHSYCYWKGVHSVDCLITRVVYKKKEYGNFDIHALPPTVEEIEIWSSRQTYALQTRALPRKLGQCRLYDNHLFGSVDLRTLPDDLRVMNLSYNNLTGPIHLLSLPRSLRRLNLQKNNIQQSVVYYDCLPLYSEEIQLISNTEPTNRIGKVCAVHAKNQVKNKWIFSGMPDVKVR